MADLEVPKVGPVNKKVVIAVVVAAGGYIGYRYWQSRSSVGTGDPAATDPGMTDGGVLPGVAGAVSPTNSYGSGSTVDPSVGGFTGTTNSEWTDYVATRLSQSDRWSYTSIVVALGNFIDNRPLSSEQQDIARAAIGLAGYPPVGSHTIVSGGNTAITVAPAGARAVIVGPTSVTIEASPVAGATTYNGYRTGSPYPTASASTPRMPFTNLSPSTTYQFQIAAVTSSGAVGPKSSSVSVRTVGVKMATPPKPTVSGITASTATLSTTAVPYATAYKWYVSGRLVGTTPTPSWTATKMTAKTRYTAAVAAQSTGGTSPISSTTAFTTKTK